MPSATASKVSEKKGKNIRSERLLPVYFPGSKFKILPECEACHAKNVKVPSNHRKICKACHEKGDGLAMQIVDGTGKDRLADFNRNHCSDDWDHSEIYNT